VCVGLYLRAAIRLQGVIYLGCLRRPADAEEKAVGLLYEWLLASKAQIGEWKTEGADRGSKTLWVMRWRRTAVRLYGSEL
jgi:hypothetical protein